MTTVSSHDRPEVVSCLVRWFFSRGALPYWLIFAVALIVRAVHHFIMSHHDPMYGYLLTGGDNHTFDRWALEISQTFWLGWGRIPFFHGPLYPYILGLSYLRFGYGADTAAWMQHFLGAITAVLIFYLARLSLGRRSGWFAGAGAVFCPIFLLYEGEILSDTLTLFLNVLVLCVAIQAGKKRTFPWWGMLGAAVGICALGRPNALLFLPVAGLWILLIARGAWLKKGAAMVVFGIAAAVCILPATCANYFIGHHFALVTYSGPFNTYIGNAPDGTGVFWSPPSMQEIRKSENKPDVDIDWSGYLWQALKKDPLLLPRSLLLKLKLFWQSGEIPHNINVYLKRPFSPFLRAPLYWGTVAPLGLVGLLAAFLIRRPRTLNDPVLVTAVFLGVYMTSIVLVFVLARLRMPAQAVLLIFAGYAISIAYESLVETVRKITLRSLLPLLCILLLWGATATALRTRDNTLLIRWNDHFNLGSAYESKGRFSEALEQYDKAVERSPEIAAIRGVRDAMRTQIERAAGRGR